jgi:hypothetical protein
VVTTIINYVWQVPYYVHFYGSHGRAPAPLAVLFLVTFTWFAVAAVLLFQRKRGGFAWMASFLVLEIGFYLLHNASGAFVADLEVSDPILFIASVLGYLNTLTGLVFLVHLLRHRGDLRPVGAEPVRPELEAEPSEVH